MRVHLFIPLIGHSTRCSEDTTADSRNYAYSFWNTKDQTSWWDCFRWITQFVPTATTCGLTFYFYRFILWQCPSWTFSRCFPEHVLVLMTWVLAQFIVKFQWGSMLEIGHDDGEVRKWMFSSGFLWYNLMLEVSVWTWSKYSGLRFSSYFINVIFPKIFCEGIPLHDHCLCTRTEHNSSDDPKCNENCILSDLWANVQSGTRTTHSPLFDVVQ